jgi:hypothetical protein
MKVAQRRRPGVHSGKLAQMAGASMRAHFVVLKIQGKADTSTPEEFYGFKPADVSEMHFRKRGAGRGLWFRLKDGRVIDAFGRRSRRARTWYAAHT